MQIPLNKMKKKFKMKICFDVSKTTFLHRKRHIFRKFENKHLNKTCIEIHLNKFITVMPKNR